MSKCFVVTDRDITVTINGTPYVVPRGKPGNPSPIADDVLKLMANPDATEDDFLYAIDVKKKLFTFTNGIITVEGDNLTAFGEPVDKYIADRILDLLKNRLPFEFMQNYWLRLRKNPSYRNRHELYKFQEHEGLCITSTGMIRAYKAITRDWKDKWTGKLDYHIGNVVKMPRTEVCDDSNIGCGPGLHAGSLKYALDYAHHGYDSEHGDRVVIVEIDPANVCSVPEDCKFQKLRTCEMKIVEEYNGPLPKWSYADSASSYDSACADTTDDDEEFENREGAIVVDTDVRDAVDALIEDLESIKERTEELRNIM